MHRPSFRPSLRMRQWLCAVAGALLPLLAGAQNIDPGLLRSPGNERSVRLVQAAKAEGRLMFYTSIAEKDLKPLLEPFEKKYGIKVGVWRASGDGVMTRVINEARARRYSVDLVHAGAIELEVLSREKLLQSVASPHFADLLPGSVPPHKEWAATLYSIWVQAYNTDSVQKSELPKSYTDLLDPRWKGRLGYEVENIDWFVTVVQSMGEARGLRFFRDLTAGNGLSVRKGHTNLNNMVASGEVPMALTMYNYMPEQLKKKGAPIDSIILQPAVARANAVGVMRNAQHPAAAALFMDYLLGEAQQVFAELDYLPSNTRISSSLRNNRILIVDPVESLDRREKWRRLYDDIIIRRARS